MYVQIRTICKKNIFARAIGIHKEKSGMPHIFSRLSALKLNKNAADISIFLKKRRKGI